MDAQSTESPFDRHRFPMAGLQATAYLDGHMSRHCKK
jgi:hypothetical protein